MQFIPGRQQRPANQRELRAFWKLRQSGIRDEGKPSVVLVGITDQQGLVECKQLFQVVAGRNAVSWQSQEDEENGIREWIFRAKMLR